MSGILRLESLTKGNTLKQGDKTPLKYRLFDADGEKLNIAGKSAVARLMYPDFLRVGYESEELTVSPDNTVTFSIDKIIQPILYYLEITVDDKYIFPSRRDESKLNIDKSSKGSDSAIIEIIGKDVIVRDIKNMVDSEIEPVVNDMIISNQKVIDNEKIVKDVQTLSEQLEARQNQVEQFNNQVITEMTDKDVISAPEIILARDGEDTLGERLDKEHNEVTAQLAQNTQRTGGIVSVSEFQSESDKDDNNAILNAINVANGGGTVIFPPKTYYVNALTINNVSDVTFEGYFSKVVYIGSSDIGIQGSNNSHIFKFENCDNITIKNLSLEGKMFEGMDKENLPIYPVENNEYVKDGHRGIYGINCSNLSLENIKTINISLGFRFYNCENLDLYDCRANDVTSGFQFLSSENISVKKCKTYDARYGFHSIASGTGEPLVNTIGSSGSGFLFSENSSGEVDGCLSYRSATNTFRIQEGSNISLFNCRSYQARRHAFSVYLEGSTCRFENCVAIDTADPTFWNGKDNENTFKRPHQIGSPTSFIVSNNAKNNVVTFASCKAKSPSYEGEVVPVSNNPDGVYKAVAQGTFLASNATGNTISVKDCEFEGYTTSDGVYLISNNTLFSRNKVKCRALTDNTIIKCLNIGGDDAFVTDNELHNGRDNLAVVGNRHVIRGNKVFNAYRTGINIYAHSSVVSDNVSTNANQGNSGGRGFTIEARDVTMGTNVVVVNRETPTLPIAVRVEGISTGFFPGNLIVKGNIGTKYNSPLSLSDYENPLFGKSVEQVDSQAVDIPDLKDDFNSLLTKLKNSGLMRSQ